MTFSPGDRLGAYEIVSVIGAGGMGEVYKARDTRLDRIVAIKVLPRHRADDSQFLSLFVREAKIASALNHPNICALYDIGEYLPEVIPGPEPPPPIHYLILEYLEGESLSVRIAKGPLPVPEALKIAIEIVAALDKAHRQGIIHRDLKPGNVMLTKSGAKLLDFGLAAFTKITVVRRTPPDPTHSAASTVTIPVAEKRTVFGTVHYMAPEQSDGEPADARADIFSFGAVLYEMATGRLAFRGETSAATFDAILHGAPIAPVRLNPSLPARLEEIINKALEKDRNLRYQHAAELRADLQRLKRDSDTARRSIEVSSGSASALDPAFASASHASQPPAASVAATPSAATSATIPSSPAPASDSSVSSAVAVAAKRHKFALSGIALLVVALIAAASYGIYSLIHEPARVPFQDFAISEETATGTASRTGISPDGKFMLVIRRERGNFSLWLRNIATQSDTQIVPPGVRQISDPMFSPDGNYAYFRITEQESITAFDLLRVPVLGGASAVIAKDVDSNPGFSADGQKIVYIRENDPVVGKMRLLLANADGSSEKILLDQSGVFPITGVAWSPDGQRVAIGVINIGGKGIGKISMFEFKDSSLHPFLETAVHIFDRIVWSPDGKWLYVVNAELRDSVDTHPQIGALSFPGANFRTITNDATTYSTISLSADGKTLATVQTRLENQLDVLPGNGSGASATVPGIPLSTNLVDLAWTAGNQLLVNEGIRLRRISPDGSNSVTIVSDPASYVAGIDVCNADSSLLISWLGHGGAFASSRMWRAGMDGSDQQPLSSVAPTVLGACSASDKWAYYTIPEGPAQKFWRVSIAGGAPEPLPDLDFHITVLKTLAISPDGHSLALFYDELDAKTRSPRHRIALLKLDENPRPPARFLDLDATDVPVVHSVGPPNNATFHFTRDGKSLAYVVNGAEAENIWLQPLDGSKGRMLTNFKSDEIYGFQWSHDGKQLAVIHHREHSDVILLRDKQDAKQ